jgi:hypothetical protein
MAIGGRDDEAGAPRVRLRLGDAQHRGVHEPGSSALARTPCSAHWWAIARVSAATPAFPRVSPPSTVMTCTELPRKCSPPCRPPGPKSMPSGTTAPRRTEAGASRTCSSEMRFSFPTSSSGPHRPQFPTCLARLRNSFMDAVVTMSSPRLKWEAARRSTIPESAQGDPSAAPGNARRQRVSAGRRRSFGFGRVRPCRRRGPRDG